MIHIYLIWQVIFHVLVVLEGVAKKNPLLSEFFKWEFLILWVRSLKQPEINYLPMETGPLNKDQNTRILADEEGFVPQLYCWYEILNDPSNVDIPCPVSFSLTFSDLFILV